jgi:hypothetical protein
MASTPIDTPIINDGSLYVSDLILSFISTTSMGLTAGAARDSTDKNDIILQSPVTLKTSYVGVNGLDGGPLTPSKCYGVYLIGDSKGYQPTGAIISLSPTQPTLPYGYDMYRRIGWAMINASSQILAFYQYGTDSTRKYYYDVADTGGVVVLSGGNQTSYTKVQLSPPGNAPVVPPLPTKVYFRNEYNQTIVTNKAEFQPFGSDATAIPTATVGLGILSLQYTNIFLFTQADLTGVQSIQYRVGTGDTTTLIVTGYEDYL